MRVYSLEDLKELLNKLMLMSGKKDHRNVQVEVFSKVRTCDDVGTKQMSSCLGRGLSPPSNQRKKGLTLD